jgi:hypothetical protein
MSLITLPIQPQAFEIIRDQLAIILASEINNQGVILPDSSLLNMKVFVEAIAPEDKEDLALINVAYVKGSYGDQKDQTGATKGVYIYNIDIYTNAKQTASSRADKTSALLLQKLLGLCRVIIDHPLYKILNFSPGFIHRVNCKEINIRDEAKNDALNSRMGRLTIEVQAQESISLPSGVLLTMSNTTVNINQTSDGYYYSVN